MKQLQNNFTTPEQSKRLKELGVPFDSADMYYHTAPNQPPKYAPYVLYVGEQPYGFKGIDEFIPCWSVGRLMEIYDICRCYDGDWDEIYGKETYIETYISAIEEAVLDEMLDFSKLEN